ncbi:hypothetical protein HK105_207070 [Polyrhizophydium stewartii]|uniref:mRNA guanylyltransferase n=1 Tax=Polyrhizophydium stewartii TaxID=2732419 RepID=A0ABR4N1V4_9FUNG
MEPEHLELLRSADYYVSELGWGVRALALLLVTPSGPAAFLMDKKCNVFYNEIRFPQPNNLLAFHNDTVLDGELVTTQTGPDAFQRIFFVFDLLAINGVCYTQRSFSSRLGLLQQDVIRPHKQLLQKSPELLAKMPFTIELRKHERAYGLGLTLDRIAAQRSPSTGVIFTPVRAPYTPGKSSKPVKLLRWLFPEYRTACFKVKSITDKDLKRHYQIMIADRSGAHKYFDEISLEPNVAQAWRSSSPDGRIIECTFDPAWKTFIWEHGYAGETRLGGWRFLRFRDDRRSADVEQRVRQMQDCCKNSVSREMLESQLETIRAHWKAREKRLSQSGVPDTRAQTSGQDDLGLGSSTPLVHSAPGRMSVADLVLDEADGSRGRPVSPPSLPVAASAERRSSLSHQPNDDARQQPEAQRTSAAPSTSANGDAPPGAPAKSEVPAHAAEEPEEEEEEEEEVIGGYAGVFSPETSAGKFASTSASTSAAQYPWPTQATHQAQSAPRPLHRSPFAAPASFAISNASTPAGTLDASAQLPPHGHPYHPQYHQVAASLPQHGPGRPSPADACGTRKRNRDDSIDYALGVPHPRDRSSSVSSSNDQSGSDHATLVRRSSYGDYAAHARAGTHHKHAAPYHRHAHHAAAAGYIYRPPEGEDSESPLSDHGTERYGTSAPARPVPITGQAIVPHAAASAPVATQTRHHLARDHPQARPPPYPHASTQAQQLQLQQHLQHLQQHQFHHPPHQHRARRSSLAALPQPAHHDPHQPPNVYSQDHPHTLSAQHPQHQPQAVYPPPSPLYQHPYSPQQRVHSMHAVQPAHHLQQPHQPSQYYRHPHPYDGYQQQYPPEYAHPYATQHRRHHSLPQHDPHRDAPQHVEPSHPAEHHRYRTQEPHLHSAADAESGAPAVYEASGSNGGSNGGINGGNGSAAMPDYHQQYAPAAAHPATIQRRGSAVMGVGELQNSEDDEVGGPGSAPNEAVSHAPAPDSAPPMPPPLPPQADAPSGDSETQQESSSSSSHKRNWLAMILND